MGMRKEGFGYDMNGEWGLGDRLNEDTLVLLSFNCGQFFHLKKDIPFCLRMEQERHEVIGCFRFRKLLNDEDT